MNRSRDIIFREFQAVIRHDFTKPTKKGVVNDKIRKKNIQYKEKHKKSAFEKVE